VTVSIVVGITGCADRVLYAQQIGRRVPGYIGRIALCPGKNVAAELGERGLVIVSRVAISDIVTRGDSGANEFATGSQALQGARFCGCDVGGDRGQRLELEWDKDVITVRVVDSVALVNVPIGISAGSDGLGLQGGRVIIRAHLLGYHIKEIVGFNGHSNRVG
jgi:hypothetical protein